MNTPDFDYKSATPQEIQRQIKSQTPEEAVFVNDVGPVYREFPNQRWAEYIDPKTGQVEGYRIPKQLTRGD